MKLLIIHLSDMHFENTSQVSHVRINKIIDAIDTVDIDECIITISGDLAGKGKKTDYEHVRGFIEELIQELNKNNFKNKKISVLAVPGNHDIDFSLLNNPNIRDIIKAYEDNTIDELKMRYINSMENYFSFVTKYGLFTDDRVISKKIIEYGDKKVGFVLCNTAPLSLLDGHSEDMGNHYLSNLELQKIEDATEADINILVLHHSIEWLKSDYKEELRKSIVNKYSLVLSGHEHSSIGQSNCIDNSEVVQFVQGNALHGYTNDGNGFCTITIDLDDFLLEVTSYIWKDSLYIPKKIIDSNIKSNSYRDIELSSDFYNQIIYDSYGKIDDHYVFPGVTYNILDEKVNMQRIDIDDEHELFNFLNNRQYTVITGEHKAGKSILAKRIYKYFYDNGKTPILIEATNVNNKKLHKTIEYVFREEYKTDNYSYEKYRQLNKSQKIAIIDESKMLTPRTLDNLMNILKEYMGQIIVFREDKINLDVRNQVVDTVLDNELTLNIKPFLYDKRKMLISNILKYSDKEFDVQVETTKINDLINGQVKYFNLNPEFIISFVNQYEKDINFKYTAGMNVFNIVYENSIINQIIDNSNEIEATHVVNILRELAYIMHFEKRSSVNVSIITKTVDDYNKNYRQSSSFREFLNATTNAKILIENNNEYRFRDRTIIAYFVALAINHKYLQEDEDIKQKIELLLRELCFSINSDIVLFLVLITNNTKFVNIIIEGAQQHFGNEEELSFDKKNVEYILDTNLPIKDSFPDKHDNEKRENQIAKHEEKVKKTDLIELVNEYDYTEEDLKKAENQVMISFKYLEILSKTLPAFCQNMKAEQQDRLVEIIYRCPNQFLFSIFKDIAENFDEFTNDLYNEIEVLRKKKNIKEISIQSVRKVLGQMSLVIIIAIYQVVASTCTNEQSIIALSAFDSASNSNHALQNLMMLARINDVNAFSKKAKDISKRYNSNLSKSIIQFTVRDFFLRNSDIKLYGESQSLMDMLFSNSTRKDMKMDRAKKRLISKDYNQR